jgi:hypothetical protein
VSDIFPDERARLVLGMLRGSHPDHDERELREVMGWAWADGYRSIVGLHGRAAHILEHGRDIAT